MHACWGVAGEPLSPAPLLTRTHLLAPPHPALPADMLPKGVREKLLHIAQAVKAKHKALEAEAAARDGSRRGGMLGGLSRKQAMDHPHAQ